MSNKTDDAGASSMLGGRVRVRNVNGQMIVKSRPKRRSGKPSKLQEEPRIRFQMAIQYAREQMAQQESKDFYKALVNQNMTSAFVAASTDFLSPPKVLSINAELYKGVAGNIIKVEAFDKVRVTRLEIVISDSDGNEIERGDAQRDEQAGNSERAGNNQWNYTTSVNNPSVTGTVITAIAYDRPGHVGKLERVM